MTLLMEELVSVKEPIVSTEKQEIHPLEESKKPPMKVLAMLIGLVAVILLGVGTGYVVAGSKGGMSGGNGTAGDVQVVKTATEEGVKDASTFKDTATGDLKLNDGKLTKEGEYVLTRGDASQNVYLTSSVVDLSKYVGKKVQVWGETFQGQSAGWLMDVGRVKLVE